MTLIRNPFDAGGYSLAEMTQAINILPNLYKVREVLRAIEDNLLGETMTSVHALVSREFFDKLIAHPKTEEAYKFYAATGAQPLREDVRRDFPFAGILFEEYPGTVTLSTKAAERLVPANEGETRESW